MSILSKPVGIFKLDDSDNSVGSFFRKDDIDILLKPFKDCDKSELKYNKDGLIDELKVLKLWNKNKIISAAERNKRSFDEIILSNIIQRAYPKASVQTQVKWESDKRKQVDFLVALNNRKLIIEFDGPSHYAHINKTWKEPTHPLVRKNAIENEFNIECVLWPFWIQRCTQNVKAIFEENERGYGALWSTSILFGDFIFEDSAQVIEEITKRFKAIDNNGLGYFYMENSYNMRKPNHPIIDEIKNNTTSINRLLPKGYKNKNYWLPDELKNVSKGGNIV